jgi:hypothetical protein
MLRAVKFAAADLARRSALCLVGLALLVVALVFFSVAAWKGLVLWEGAIAAALVMGAVYAVLGVIALLLARRRARREVALPAPAPRGAPLSRLAFAFMEGLDAGIAARRRRAARRGAE